MVMVGRVDSVGRPVWSAIGVGHALLLGVLGAGCSQEWDQRLEGEVPTRVRGVSVTYDVAGLVDPTPAKRSYRQDAVGPLYDPGPLPPEDRVPLPEIDRGGSPATAAGPAAPGDAQPGSP
jgi:hypothetical protein